MKKFLKNAILVLFIIAIVGIVYLMYISNNSNPENYKKISDIPTPSGYVRVPTEKGSFGNYLRNLPLKPKDSKIKLYKGEEAQLQFLGYAVVDMPLFSNDEQCADVCMRLWAEYLYSKGLYNKISFTNVNGKKMAYQGGNSRDAFKKYMRNVFAYCNTNSLHRYIKKKSLANLEVGDIFVYPWTGYGYGHAVMVADIAKNEDGEMAVLCVEGNTPARDIHVIRNPFPFRDAWSFINKEDSDIYINCFHFSNNNIREF